MTRKLSAIFILSLLVVAFIATSVFAAKSPVSTTSTINRVPIDGLPAAKVAGAENMLNYVPPAKDGGTQSLGFDQVAAVSPGMQIGITTYDYQHNGRMGRQVDWRGTQWVHMDWMKQTQKVVGSDRGTGYEAWDPVNASLAFMGAGGGCDVHPRLGSGVNYSGYVTLDVEPKGNVVIGNHHDEGTGQQLSTAWYDFGPGACYFAPYRAQVPYTFMTCCFTDPLGEYYEIWPSVEVQVNGTDTVTHIFAQQSKAAAGSESYIMYFRRVGGDTSVTFPGGGWDAAGTRVVAQVQDIAQTVTASRTTRRVALVWLNGYTSPPGDTADFHRGQRANDVFYQISTNMGAAGSWGPKHNVTKNDSSKTMWLAHTDLSALMDSGDKLHIIWNAREASNGLFLHVYGSRLFHWDETNNLVRVIKDANWDLADPGCNGGAWNEMSIVKMSISECDGKFYALFTQFNDVANGINDNCHKSAWTGNTSGTANGVLYISVSDNGGLNWDIARNLTNNYLPRCDTIAPAPICESDMWSSMARFGMTVTDGDFTGVPIVNPAGGGTYTKFLDVEYINDLYPGGCVQDAGVWTTNPVRWFRIPCVNPVPNPLLVFTPSAIKDPAWTKKGVEKDTTLRLENVGNAVLHISGVTAVKLTGTSYDWLGFTGAPATVSHLVPNYVDMTVQLNKGGAYNLAPAVGFDGLLIFNTDSPRPVDTFRIHLIIADTVQFPKWVEIRTASKRLTLNNAGNMGDGDHNTTNYNMNFFADCDTLSGAKVYLYDGSPFILRLKGTDTVMNGYFYNANWLDNNGFRPLKATVADSTTYPDYRYAFTNKFLTKDSVLGLDVAYYASKSADSSSFIIEKVRVYNNTASTVSGVTIGEYIDWDIPSDTGVENSSNFDAGRQLMYQAGAEYGPETTVVNCVDMSKRMGGIAYYTGWKIPFPATPVVGTDSFPNVRGMLTTLNSDWVYPTGNIVPQQAYNKFLNFSGYETWQSTNPSTPDSIYNDLSMFAVYGTAANPRFNIGATDTLVFVKILATEYNIGLANLQLTIDKAKQWCRNRPGIFSPTRVSTCCVKAGDANHNGAVNVIDVTYIINFLYKGGAKPPCQGAAGKYPEADANGNGAVNVIDVTYIINFLYKGGAAPICGPM